MTYSGDAYIVLQTKVQVSLLSQPFPFYLILVHSLINPLEISKANPLNVPRPSLDILGSPRILFAAAPLVVPMTLRLSSLSLRAIVVLVVSRQKGITLVFKNDPLESVDVSSSFDGVESVAGFIQREIEAQLREAFRSDLPSVIHRLSQKWLSGEVKSAGEGTANLGKKARVGLAGGFEKDAKIETRTAYVGGGEGGVASQGLGGTTRGGRGFTRNMNAPASEMGESVELASQPDSTWSTNRSTNGGGGGSFGRSPSMRGRAGSTSSPALRHDQLDSVPESIEAYDPTYGLRPDSIPHHAGFADYQRLVKAGSSKRGLGDVLEDEGGEADEADQGGTYGHPRTGDGSFDFDMIGLRDLVEDDDHAPLPRWNGSTTSEYGRPHLLPTEPTIQQSQFETIPAVGGGTITRPRVFHTQSQMRMRTDSTGSLSAHGSPSSTTARSAGGGSAASTVGLGRAANFARSASLNRMPTVALDGREEYFAAPSAIGGGSVASTPRFPFPRYPHAPPPAYSAGSTAPPSLPRNQSMPNFNRYQSQNAIHRSNLSWQLSASSTSNDAASSRFPPQYASSSTASPQTALTTPMSSPTRNLKPLPTEGDSLSFTRPSPVDLLSRSPSSVLNTSFLDEEHLPITLNPGANDSCAHLKTLSSTNQTLSPFTRENELVMARSSPRPLTPSGGGGGRLAPTAPLAASGGRVLLNDTNPQPSVVKATRKRLHRIGSAKPAAPSSAASSKAPSSLYSPSPAISRRHSYQPSPISASVPNAHRKMPSLSGSVGVGVGMMGRGSRAPSELSDYFPSSGSGAREMLSRLKLSG